MATRTTRLHIENGVTSHDRDIIAHYPPSVVIPKLIALFAAYEKCADVLGRGDWPVTVSLRVLNRRRVHIGIHPGADPAEARRWFDEFVALAGDALDLLRGYLAERSEVR